MTKPFKLLNLYIERKKTEDQIYDVNFKINSQKFFLPLIAFHSSDKTLIAVQYILDCLGQLQVSKPLCPL